MNISSLLAPLAKEGTDHPFRVVPIPQWSGALVGFDVANRPCVFLEAGEKMIDPPLRTSNISLWPSAEFTLTFPGGAVRSGRYHLLQCESSAPEDQATFVVIVGGFLSSAAAITPLGPALVSFFQSASRLLSIPKATDLARERQGLWGELFMMSRVRGFKFWMPFWHAEVNRLFDFSAAADRHVEVKTTTLPERTHRFSHRQVFALGTEEILIGSLALTPQHETGLSLRQLVDDCRDSVAETPYLLKVEAAVRHSGMEDEREIGPRFDEHLAWESLRWYWARDVPQFRTPEPPGVSETHYRVDLEGVAPVPPSAIVPWLERWASGTD
jgi:hypothetical protein